MHRTSVFLVALALVWPSLARAQAKDAFVNGLVDIINATEGTFGDEGPTIIAAVDAMAAGLVQWDAAIARAEAGFASEIGGASADVAARMRAALGTIYLERGRFDAALAQFSQAAELDPRLADVHVLRAAAYSLAGRPAEAAEAYRAAWERDQRNPLTAYLFLRTLKDAASDEAQAAQRVLLEAIDKRTGAEGPAARFLVVALLDDGSVPDPLFPGAAYQAAVDLLAQARYDDAVARFRAAAVLDPLVTDAALQSAGVRRAAEALRQENPTAAIAGFTEAVAATPGSPELRRLLGVSYRAAKQYDKSLEQLRSAERANPSNERARIAIADVLAGSGDAVRARESLADTLQSVPGSAQVLWNLGRLHQTLGDGRNALRSFTAAAERRPYAGAGRLFAAIGALHHTLLDFAAAATAYERRIDVNPNESAAHADLGDVYRAQERDTEAMREFVIAALLDPGSARAVASIGQLYADSGRDVDAVRMLRKAVGLDPAHREARYALGRALLRLGNTQEGQEQLRVYGELQSKALEEERRRFRENQDAIEDALEPAPGQEPRR